MVQNDLQIGGSAMRTIRAGSLKMVRNSGPYEFAVARRRMNADLPNSPCVLSGWPIAVVFATIFRPVPRPAEAWADYTWRAAGIWISL